jgi:hypothetical protein
MMMKRDFSSSSSASSQQKFETSSFKLKPNSEREKENSLRKHINIIVYANNFFFGISINLEEEAKKNIQITLVYFIFLYDDDDEQHNCLKVFFLLKKVISTIV